VRADRGDGRIPADRLWGLDSVPSESKLIYSR
jgi:hypothetical protein